MSEILDWGLPAILFLLGNLCGGLIVHRVAQARAGLRQERANSESRKRHQALIQELRATNARTQAELEQARASFKRQLASASEAPRAAAQRAEERLEAAYAELDRLREKAASLARPKALDVQGFAQTEITDR